MSAYELLLLNTSIPQIQAAQTGDTYVCPRDIAFSAALTLSAGTANGVPYLNASKVLTTGSALTFDGTNLGLGVTPSAWGSAYRTAFQNKLASLTGLAGTSVMELSANFYLDNTGTGRYIATDYATQYQQLFGAHKWFTAPSGNANDPISFTQAMTLDASGNLIVGDTATSSSAKTYVKATSGSSDFSNNATLFLNAGTETTTANLIRFNGAVAKGLVFGRAINADSFVWGFTNTTTPAMTLDASGNLLVGQTLRGLRDSNSFDFDVTDSSAYINHVTGSASGSAYVYFGYAAGAIGSISQNGTTGVLYNITSDYRLKNVVGAVTGAGARIDALKPVAYTWKADGSAARGFLAHEFQAVYPNSVTGAKDAVDEEGKPVYQNMQASTSEVIADLVAELQSLRARVAQLEGK